MWSFTWNGDVWFYSIVLLVHHFSKSRDSAVGIATGCGLDDKGFGVRVPVGQEFSQLHAVQTGPGAHPASYAMGTGGFLPGG
jgi:hypothetical protein